MKLISKLLFVILLVSSFSFVQASGWVQRTLPNMWNNVLRGSEIVEDEALSKLYYINTNYQVCTAYKTSTSFGDAILNRQAPLANPSGRGLSMSSNGIYYTTADRKICRLYYQNGWKFEYMNMWNTVLANSEISATDNLVYYVNTSHQVCCLYKTSTGWNDAILNASTYARGKGLRAINDGVYYVGAYMLYHLHWTSNGWVNDLIWDGNKPLYHVDPDSEIEVSADGNEIYFVAGYSTRTMCSMRKTETGWKVIYWNSGYAPKIKAGTNFYVSDGAYYITDENKICKLWKKSGTYGWGFTILNPNGPNAYRSVTGMNGKIYFGGANDGKMHEFYYSTKNGIDESVDYTLEETIISDGSESKSVAVFPNPAKDYINISTKGIAAKTVLEISNQSGTKVLEVSVEDDAVLEVDITALPKGLYYISASADKTISYCSFVKE